MTKDLEGRGAKKESIEKNRKKKTDETIDERSPGFEA